MRVSMSWRNPPDRYSEFKEVASDPDTGNTGDIILNTTSNQVKMWLNGIWEVLHTISVEDYNILLESGDNLLLESGDIALLEG